jgi:hypothetical protein
MRTMTILGLGVVLIAGCGDDPHAATATAHASTTAPADAAAKTNTTSTTPTSGAQTAMAGTVTAVRSKDGLPTFCLIAAQPPVPAVGTTLTVMRQGSPVATVVVELLTDANLTARITGWATSSQTISVGDTVVKP